MVAGYPRTTSGHMSQGIGTFHNGRQHILPRTGKRNIQDPILSKLGGKSVYARFHRGLGHLKFDSIIDLIEEVRLSLKESEIRETTEDSASCHHSLPPTDQRNGRAHACYMGHAITTLTQGRPDRWDDICNRRTEFTDNEQEDSDFGQEDFIEQENYDMENEELLIKKIITNKSKSF
ncbi:hypothetical protein BASA83_005808 [Batrachochytrium salamandrivorans]|nr:hypothetical protein BASA83_005808 [Batrachochytrium salamandrivorans]